MTKLKAKASNKGSVTKASRSKTSASKRSAVPAANDAALIVLGFNDRQKPCGARFERDEPNLVTKAAELMGLKVYKTSNPEVAALAKKLPVGRLYANGRGALCRTCGKFSTATLLWPWRPRPRRWSAMAAKMMCCLPRVACPSHGTRLRPAIS
jgi:hypothetical protein